MFPIYRVSRYHDNEQSPAHSRLFKTQKQVVASQSKSSLGTSSEAIISSGLAERITPISVKHSGTKNGHEAYYAIDKDNSTWSQTEKDAQKKTFAWIKFTLDKVIT